MKNLLDKVEKVNGAGLDTISVYAIEFNQVKWKGLLFVLLQTIEQ